MIPNIDPENEFVKKFKSFVHEEGLWGADHKILAAVSGGVDSVVLAHLLSTTGVSFAIAHCNFNLRGKESAGDQAFTSGLAQSLGTEFFSEQFDTYGYAFKEGISVEMAARDLRYEWFKSLATRYGYDFIVTGHHADDQIETMLLNLSRGTGISGLRGMLPKTGQIVRPLLQFFRSEILQFATNSGMQWREDSTNSSTEIQRNLIRHSILPLFGRLNPNFRETIIRTMKNVREAEVIYHTGIDEKLAAIITLENDVIRVDIRGLKVLKPLGTWMFELLSPFGFNRATAEAVEKALDGLAGKQFSSQTHRLIKDRHHLIITKTSVENPSEIWEYFISEDIPKIFEPLNLKFRKCKSDDFKLNDNPDTAALDLERLRFPLSLRRWIRGDSFVPLGMKNRKKLSDFFSDIKLSVQDKEQVWVLTSGDDIVWVIGYRIDDRYKITSLTKKIFTIEL